MKKTILVAFSTLLLSYSLKAQTTSVKIIEVKNKGAKAAVIKAINDKGEIFTLRYGWSKHDPAPTVGEWLQITPLKTKRGRYLKANISVW